LERKVRDSCGSSGTGETPQAFTPRRLTARPTESEHPGAQINHHNTCYIATRFKKTAFILYSFILTKTLLPFIVKTTFYKQLIFLKCFISNERGYKFINLAKEMINLKTYVVENGVQATQIIQELEGQGYSKDQIYLFAHDSSRSKHLTDQTDTRHIGLKEEGMIDKIANLFQSRGENLRTRMTSLGLSQNKASELEEELDEGKVVIVAQ